MQMINCPNCRTPNRSNARFCGKCGYTLQVVATQPAAMPTAPAQPVYPQQAMQPTAVAPMSPMQPAVRQVGSAVAGGAVSIVRRIARFFTLGGHAAYADIVAPEVAASGMIFSPPSQHQVQSPLEIGFFIWIATWFVGAITLWIPRDGFGAIVFFALYVFLLILSLLGLRQPYFSRLTLATIAHFVTGKGRATQIEMVFSLNTFQQEQVFVTLVGAMKNLTPQTMPQQQHLVQLWGIQVARNLRAWKLQYLDVNTHNPVDVILSTPRVVPLSAMLFFPLTFYFVIWLIAGVFFR